jgi:hypothetical protein
LKGQGERRHDIESINEKQEVVKKNNKSWGMKRIGAKKIRTVHAKSGHTAASGTGRHV